MLDIKFSPIGIVSNGVNEPLDVNWGPIISRLNINPEFAEGTKGLNQFSHAMIVTLLNRAKFDLSKHLVRKPRGLYTMPEVGIFAQRAKDRPNLIGVTAVKIINVGNGSLDVRGLDAINGTPILDIKPYYPHYDLVEDATIPKWVDRLMQNYF
ncbi:MAG: tRNA (N6-threonylcarbamoyladenosine(37)-N6)-methyltransferase TrmO [Ignavibacteriales bacterium]|nr:tRNA (N6-threonylcarbamoyladenosine(37)-N6)-methyltransferase TrmO [Ignavibacteriales bacterium]MBI3788192.1 tRNA (N6-threonylcarbamoyladenosine(37)-N6)-methyltransferase TrmO [Ignavibacteriales bacterium]